MQIIKINQLCDIKPSSYFVQFFIQYIEKQGNLLYLDDEIFPKIETICYLIKILCLSYDKTCLIVTDGYKVDNWKIKVQKWVQEKKISKIQNQNDIVQSCPLVIIVNYEYLNNNFECFFAINFEILIIDIHVDQIKTENLESLKKLRSQIKSVVVMENQERLNNIEDYWFYLEILHPTIFSQKRQKKYLKRYSTQLESQVSYQEFNYILSEFFQSSKTREKYDECQSLFQKFSIELNNNQKKQVKLIQRTFNGYEIDEFANIGYHTNEDINIYFQYLTNLKEQFKNIILKYVNLLKRKTLVIADGDQVLCKLFKKYKNTQFVSSESDLNTINLQEFGQILILEVTLNNQNKYLFFLKRQIKTTKQKEPLLRELNMKKQIK